jgi:probable addiction module antidote protein
MSNSSNPKSVVVYQDLRGKEPFTDWLNSLRRSIKHMINFRTLDEVTIEYFTQHPEEIDAFISEAFADYAQDGDSAVLLSTLRIIARVKGISNMAAEIGMTRQGLQKALSARGNPRLDNVNAIMRAMGYQLMPHRLEDTPV